jgi:hypothetical protein
LIWPFSVLPVVSCTYKLVIEGVVSIPLVVGIPFR